MSEIRSVQDYKDFLKDNRELLHKNAIRIEDLPKNDDWILDNEWDVIYEQEAIKHVKVGKSKLLWMIGEVGEVIDIVKKYGSEASNADNPEREHLIEELADVLMYYNDVLLCYGITAEELKDTYTNKFQKNMKRWLMDFKNYWSMILTSSGIKHI